jgi:hypothetical protein
MHASHHHLQPKDEQVDDQVHTQQGGVHDRQQE